MFQAGEPNWVDRCLLALLLLTDHDLAMVGLGGPSAIPLQRFLLAVTGGAHPYELVAAMDTFVASCNRGSSLPRPVALIIDPGKVPTSRFDLIWR